jgi:hypothetical protein
MAFKFGRIDHSETTFEETVFHKNQTLTSASTGVHHVLAKKDDYTDPDRNVTLSDSGSHWASIHGMFYLSGSIKISEIMPADSERFNSIYHNFNQHNDLKPFHKNKFYETASVFYIPQQYFGERIKPGTFQLTARTGSSSNTTKEIIIKDDKNGNLYATDAAHSQSANTSSGSKDNYVGNIFYDLGVATLTETASWSGSVNYTDIGGIEASSVTAEKNYKFWELKINSTTPIFTSQYSIKVNGGDFNRAMNATTRTTVSGSIPSGSDVSKYINLKDELTGSGWSPYFTQIQLHENQTDESVIIANLPRPVKVRDDIDLIITFRIDH